MATGWKHHAVGARDHQLGDGTHSDVINAPSRVCWGCRKTKATGLSEVHEAGGGFFAGDRKALERTPPQPYRYGAPLSLAESRAGLYTEHMLL
jgi:hypothetical protein